MKTKTAVIVEDDLLFAEMLAFAFEKKLGLRIGGLLSNVADALKFEWDSKPKLIVLDWALPDGTPEELIPHVHAISPLSCWLGLTGVNDPRVILRMTELGMQGICTKTSRMDQLCEAAQAGPCERSSCRCPACPVR